MDGFAAHHDQVDDDTAKRQAILDSGRFRFWSLGWRDLPEVGREVSDRAAIFLDGLQRESEKERFGKLAVRMAWGRHAEYQETVRRGPLYWLQRYLTDPEEARVTLEMAARSRAFGVMDMATLKDPELREAALTELDAMVPGWMRRRLRGSDANPPVVGGSLQALSGTAYRVGFALVIPRDALLSSASLTGGIRAVFALDDGKADTGPDFEADWQAFWGATNLLQFLPGFQMMSAQGVAAERYAPGDAHDQKDAPTRDLISDESQPGSLGEPPPGVR
ncbi:hypothetical protein [Thioalkalivibrio versutus]|nr:hypothetical protein [Thioalkalivibrio versutus]